MTLQEPEKVDSLPISVRAYVDSRPPNRERALPKPSDWAVIFDTETTTDPGQTLRFGTYQVRHGKSLYQAGIFYDDQALTSHEIKVIEAFAKEGGLSFISRERFVDDILYRFGYDLRGTIVAFNFPFDGSRIALGHASARKEMRGGFTFKLSSDKRKPPIQIKHLSRRAALIRFAAPFKQLHARSARKRGDRRVRRGFFVDVHTLAAALFARTFSLASLAEFLMIEHQKLSTDEHGGTLTPAYLRYALRDVETTWDCYEELVKRFGALHLADTYPPQIFSEASIGKAYLRGMGIQPWRQVQRDIPAELLARILACYYGGRSEVRIRRELRQVVLCDFLSMYPTVCTLMGLWSFVTAQGIEWCVGTKEIQEFIANVTLGDLQDPSLWKKLTALVRIEPDWDVLPIRAPYEEGAQPTIGANYLKADQPMWFTLADCVVAKLLTGKTPKVIEAIVFSPGKQQSGLRSVAIAGNQDYVVDPAQHDFYQRLIELRNEVKGRRDKAKGASRQSLDTEQNALKIAANATSYGIFVEVNVKDRAEPQKITVYSSTSPPYEVHSLKDESPGRFFHPLLATLITGAARLMLAIAERLVIDRGLDWAFCDTDSMAIAKPADMPEEDFYRRVDEIVAWFAGLNPYPFKGSILKVEDVNLSLTDPNKREPLFCWAVSAKRYALFNLERAGRPILRKASAHGLGHWQPPYDASNPAESIPIPAVPLGKLGVELWQHDLWWEIVCAALAGRPDQVELNYHPALSRPAVSRYAASTPKLLKWFDRFNKKRSYGEQVKPFGFLYALQADPLMAHVGEVLDPQPGRKRTANGSVKPVAPYDKDLTKAVAGCFDRETGLPVASNMLLSYKQAIAHYHLHPESKFINGDYLNRGVTRRRHVYVTVVRNIGKEANEWEQQFYLGFDEDEQIDYGLAPHGARAQDAQLRKRIRELGMRRISRESQVSRRTIERILRGDKIRSSILSRITSALRKIAGE